MRLVLDDLMPEYDGDPAFLPQSRDHLNACVHCRTGHPGVSEKLALLEIGARERALQQIQKLSVEYATEFGTGFTSEADDLKLTDQVAALASTYSAPLMWHLSFLLPEPRWSDFTVLANPGSERASIGGCFQHLNTLPRETVLFVFAALLANEVYLKIFSRLSRMQMPTLFRTKPDGFGFEAYDNPDYPIYQSYELRALQSLKYATGDGEDPHYGSPTLLSFIREKLRETLLESSVDARIFTILLEQAAAAYVLRSEHMSAEFNGAIDPPPLASTAFGELRSDVNDGIDSIKATQMEILHALGRDPRSANAFLPLIQSRLGGTYGYLHSTTKRLLALGEYFRSLNQAEPDAMNVVVLHQAKACEHELFMRIFGPYVMRLLESGTLDYLVDAGRRIDPLLRGGQEVSQNMKLGTYCWYLKNDRELGDWVKSTLRLPLPALINEAYWISMQRNRAAHEADYKEYDVAIFQNRLFDENGLLRTLHPAT